MKEMPTYSGDANFQELLVELPIKKTFAEIRAMVMRDVWALDMVQPSKTLQEAIGSPSQALKTNDQAQAFITEFMALWNELTKHQDPEQPFKLWAFPEPPSSAEAKEQLHTRIAEVKILRGIFDLDERRHPGLADTLAMAAGKIDALLAGIETKGSLDPEVDKEIERALNAAALLLKGERARVLHAGAEERRRQMTDELEQRRKNRRRMMRSARRRGL